jgi:hypothetical protein
MTAEIAVMNRVAIALAADSAATSMHGNVAKIYDTADKLFNLDHSCPVGAMLYGGSAFLDLPWEIVIKQFRAARSGVRSRLKEYANEFLAFLTSDELISDEFVDAHFFSTCRNNLHDLLRSGRQRRKTAGGSLIESIKLEAKESSEELSNRPFLAPMDATTLEVLRERYGAALSELTTDWFKAAGPADSELSNNVIDFLLLLMTKDVEQDSTGLVIAGYGKDELFPGLIQLEIEGVVYPRTLRYRQKREAGISLENRARIVPFAQAEMVHSFMTGADPRFKANVSTVFEKLLERFGSLLISEVSSLISPAEQQRLSEVIANARHTATSELREELNEYARKYHIDPVVDAVAVLPKDQLAVMAETLVALTSFKRRMSKDLETVGGAIDVAVISKGDGFVWIKRKHYFERDLNPRYFQRIQSQS